MGWDDNYRQLKEDEIIKKGDEVFDDREWIPTVLSVGSLAPDPKYTSHRQFRRLKGEPK